MPWNSRQVWVNELKTFAQLSAQAVGNKLDAQAVCPRADCKFLATVRSKSSEAAVIKSLKVKFNQHAPKCPKK